MSGCIGDLDTPEYESPDCRGQKQPVEKAGTVSGKSEAGGEAAPPPTRSTQRGNTCRCSQPIIGLTPGSRWRAVLTAVGWRESSVGFNSPKDRGDQQVGELEETKQCGMDQGGFSMPANRLLFRHLHPTRGCVGLGEKRGVDHRLVDCDHCWVRKWLAISFYGSALFGSTEWSRQSI